MEFNKKQQKIISIAFVIFIVGGWLSMICYDSISSSKREHAFYDHKIIGKIAHTNRGHSTIHIKIEGSDGEYDFNQISEEEREIEMYDHISEGDSIFHEAYSDTVLIKKDGQLYKYTIFKP